MPRGRGPGRTGSIVGAGGLVASMLEPRQQSSVPRPEGGCSSCSLCFLCLAPGGELRDAGDEERVVGRAVAEPSQRTDTEDLAVVVDVALGLARPLLGLGGAELRTGVERSQVPPPPVALEPSTEGRATARRSRDRDRWPAAASRVAFSSAAIARIAISGSACVASRARRSLASRSRVVWLTVRVPSYVQMRSARGWVLATSPARLSTYRASGTCRTSVRALPCIQRHIDTHYRETVGGDPRRLVGNAGGQPACRRPGAASRGRADRQPPRQQGEHSRPRHGRPSRPQQEREPRPGCGRQPRPQSRLRPGHCPCGGDSPGGAAAFAAWRCRQSLACVRGGAGGPGRLAAELDRDIPAQPAVDERVPVRHAQVRLHDVWRVGS